MSDRSISVACGWLAGAGIREPQHLPCHDSIYSFGHNLPTRIFSKTTHPTAGGVGAKKSPPLGEHFLYSSSSRCIASTYTACCFALRLSIDGFEKN